MAPVEVEEFMSKGRVVVRADVVIAFLLGIIVALSVALVFNSRSMLAQSYAGTASGSGGVFGVTGLGTGGNKDLLWVIDSEGQKIAVYDAQGDVIQLKSVRNIRYDLKLDEWPFKRQRPSPLDVFKLVEKDTGGSDDGRRSRRGSD